METGVQDAEPGTGVQRSPHLTDADLEYGLREAEVYTRQFCRTNPATDRDNVESFCYEGAYLAWLRWRPSGGAAWKTFLHQYLVYYALKALEGERRHQAVSIEGLFARGEDGDSAGREFAQPGVSSADLQAALSVLRRLPADQARIIVLRSYHNLTLKETARVLDWNFMRVFREERAARARIAEYLVEH